MALYSFIIDRKKQWYCLCTPSLLDTWPSGSICWSICGNLHGWVCHASEDEVRLYKAWEVSAWFVKYRPYKTRGFCRFVRFVGEEGWESCSILRREGEMFALALHGILLLKKSYNFVFITFAWQSIRIDERHIPGYIMKVFPEITLILFCNCLIILMNWEISRISGEFAGQLVLING